MIKKEVLKEALKQSDNTIYLDDDYKNVIDLTLAEVGKAIDEKIKEFKHWKNNYPKVMGEDMDCRMDDFLEFKQKLGIK